MVYISSYKNPTTGKPIGFRWPWPCDHLWRFLRPQENDLFRLVSLKPQGHNMPMRALKMIAKCENCGDLEYK